MTTQRSVQLIAYADRFGGSVAELHRVLAGPLAGMFDGVHVLPFFTPYDGADAGFDPTDHTAVDPRLGGWDDVRALSRDYTVMADLIVNHVSAASEEFRDYMLRGAASSAAGMFLTMSDVYSDGAREDDLAGIYRPRPGLPFTVYPIAGRRRLLWTTFTSQQIDLNLRDPAGRAYLDRVLGALVAGGVTMVRLDAVGYAIKTAGTTSFLTTQTLAFIEELTGQAHALGVRVLVEVHSYFEEQAALAAQVDWTYDFALPPLLLHALFTGRVDALVRWMRLRPPNAITVLDTHDGIGVVDVGAEQGPGRRPGLLSDVEIDSLVEEIHRRSNGQSRQATGWAASNVDVYQVNCTYYDAVGSDDHAYLLARAVQLFAPGIAQVYYVGLLAGHNDMELLASTGVGRDINRHHYTAAEIEDSMRRPVVEALCNLIRLRRTCPAFDGDFTMSAGESSLVMTWTAPSCSATLVGDFTTRRARIVVAAAGAQTVSCADLLTDSGRLLP